MNTVEHVEFELDDLETREADGFRYVLLRAVPYEQEIQLSARTSEVFTRGALASAAIGKGRVPFTFGHPDPTERAQGQRIIGVMSSGIDREHAFYAEMKIAATPLAAEAMALMDVGALKQVSIGFRRTEGGTKVSERGKAGQLNRHNRVGLDHVALVRDGAYGDGAQVEAIRASGFRLDDLRQMLGQHQIA